MKNDVDETRIAEMIVSVLPEGVVRACSPDRETIRYSVRAEGMKLRTIVLKRASLRKLAKDPARGIKIEYLQRDIVASATRRNEYRYPRLTGLIKAATSRRRVPFGIAIASMV